MTYASPCALGVTLLLVTLALPAPIRAEAAALAGGSREAFLTLRSAVVDALPHGGNGEGELDDESRERLHDLREGLAAVPRAGLSDPDWLDLHLALQALDRRLSRQPERAGKRGEPSGRSWFDWKLRHTHQIDMNAADLELLGEQVYAGTVRELERCAESIDPHRTWQELSRLARRDGPGSASGLVPMCRRLSQEAWRFAEDSGFVSVPEVAIELGLRQGKERGDKPFAWYRPGKLEDGFYTGTYMVTPIPDELEEPELERLLGDVNVHWMRVVSLHEGIPGHHLQFAVASLVDSPVRKWGYTSVFVEGWGLYCEEAMYRHGFYIDPLTRLEQLRMRLWRCARMVIDSRLHTGGMTRQEAVDLLVDGVRMAPDNASREVDRYLTSPTQPMSYVAGMMQMEQLRKRAQAQAGDAWDERAFHDRLLSFGPVPIDLVGAIILGERDLYDGAHP